MSRFHISKTAMLIGLIGVTLGLGSTVTPATAVAKPRFRLSVDPTSLTVARGSSSSVAVLVTRVGSFTGPIKLTSSTRKGLKMVFDENPLIGDDTDLVATADATASVSATTLTVSGTDGRTTVRIRLRVKVTAGQPIGAAVATTTTAVPSTTVSSSTTAAPSTVSTATTSTTPATTTAASTTSTTGPPAAVGDVIITRKVSQSTPCAPAIVGLFVSTRATVTNPDTSARIITVVPPGSCTEIAGITLPPGAFGGLTVTRGALLVIRSAATSGNPIRRVVAALGQSSISVSSTANMILTCTGPIASNGVLVPLTDGQQFVLNNIPVGASCKLVDQYDFTPPRAFIDTIGLPSDATVLVPGRPAACSTATTSTAVPGPVGCYAEFTHIF